MIFPVVKAITAPRRIPMAEQTAVIWASSPARERFRVCFSAPSARKMPISRLLYLRKSFVTYSTNTTQPMAETPKLIQICFSESPPSGRAPWISGLHTSIRKEEISMTANAVLNWNCW